MAERAECCRMASLPLKMKFYRCAKKSSQGSDLPPQAEERGWKVRLVAGPWSFLPCTSVTIGNYKVLSILLTVTAHGIELKVPSISQEVITVVICMNDILKVLAHFGKSSPSLFLFVSQDACARIRRQLNMLNSGAFYLDVLSLDWTQKMITILPNSLPKNEKAILKQHFRSKLQQLESRDANEVLVRSSPIAVALKQAPASPGVNISETRLKQFMALLRRCIDEKNRAESLELHVVRAFFATAEKNSPFSEAEIDACIEKMSDDNKLMRSEDTIYVI